ncbi:MAG: phosphatase PAP2 family protein [Adhaeribacter sp.]
MKKISTIILAFSCSCLLSCDQDVVESNAGYQALQPVHTDAGAGTWTPMLVTSAAEFPLPVPQPVSSAAYQQELKEVKDLRGSLTGEQQRIIDYWKVGSVLRWNEIMRELVAKHNLPPYQNPDNTYPVPSAANPFAYPEFPFSNPPYASRAYAYVTLAQYDALVMAHHFKAAFKRPAPYQVDAGLDPLVPESSLAAYPSEDAVVAGATYEMMKLLFPADMPYIRKMAEEEKNYRLWSGANVRSDVVAGDSLGRWVARKVIQRARTDGMGQAGGSPAVWAQLEADCQAKGETPWLSLEVPRRPPMLPLFGKVKPLLLPASEVAALRPGPPPSAGSPQMRQELDELISFTKKPTRERMRIVNLWADGVATYTPPGHWNAIATGEFVKRGYSEVRWARNYALLNAALMDAAIVCWDTKFHYFNARPCQLDARVKTLTGMPNFPAYISGHSTFSAAAAAILGHLLPERAADFQAMALEASNSRMYAGIHYRADCEAGLQVGRKVGGYAIERAKTDGAE